MIEEKNQNLSIFIQKQTNYMKENPSFYKTPLTDNSKYLIQNSLKDLINLVFCSSFHKNINIKKGIGRHIHIYQQ